MDLARPENVRLREYFVRGNPAAPSYAPWDSVKIPYYYYRCGCHPDIVERIWEQIGGALPTPARCLIYGRPALAHPQGGVILAIGLGTQYGLRLPEHLLAEAIAAGAKTHTVWSGGSEQMDIRRDFGDDWVLGAWLGQEPAWCRTVYDRFAPAAPTQNL